MKLTQLYRQPLYWLSAIAIAAGSTVTPAAAAPNPGSDRTDIAQTVSLCRQVYEPLGLVVRAEASPYSARVGGVDRGDRVTLAENYSAITGPDGRTWIPITYPVTGFVSNGYVNGTRSNLIYCRNIDPVPDPEPLPGERCRRVLAEQGLTVRAQPTPFSARVGGVGYNDRVTLVEGYRGIQGPEGRIWIGIVEPLSGFVSNGYGGASNLARCIVQ